MNLRTAAAVIGGKIAARMSRLAGRGGGTAIAGLVALRIDPQIVRRLTAQAGAGAILVTGTNGKTTTALMLNRIAREAGLWPLHNRSGSNLMRGLAAMLVDEASLSATIPASSTRLAILEVDEATLPEAATSVDPRVIVFTNLFRDQLDRYGEVDSVAQAWERAVAERASTGTGHMGPVLVLNADDPAVAHLGGSARRRVMYFGVDDPDAVREEPDHASDFRVCLDCGSALSYATTYYGHVGHWRCPKCGNARPVPHVRLTSIEERDERLLLEAALPEGCLHLELPLAGLYNAYNALAAIAGALAIGLPRDAIVRALEGFTAAFGRQERFDVEGRDVRVLLGKNPTGLNQVLRTVAAAQGERRLLFVLNDGIADGRDVSWIWDADYELARPGCVWVMAAGTRAEDLALRLKYAGYGDDPLLERDAAIAVRRAIAATPAGATLHIIPTYTAMLEVRELLAKHAGVRSFWEDA